MNTNHNIPALDKAVSILEYLGRTESGASQSELAKALDITTSTCYRILQTLLARNWVCQKPGNLYDVSNGILTATLKLIDSSARFECLQPLLEQLANKTGLSCKLSIRQADVQLTVLRAESPAPMAISGKVGVHFPIIEGSTGAALLCTESEESIERLLLSCSDDIEEKNNPRLIQKRLNSLIKKGYCLNSHPTRWNIETMAAPIKSAAGDAVAAITVLGFADDFSGKKTTSVANDLLATVLECTQII